MKKALALLLSVAMLFVAGCTKKEPEIITEPPVEQYEEIRGVWLSCYELAPMFAEGSEQAFEKAAGEAVEKCAANGINALFVQLRPFCDALYPSKLFGWSKFALSDNGTPPDYDPLEIIIRLAHAKSIAVHAWVNPYRITYSTDVSEIPDIAEEHKSSVAVTDCGIYFDPSSTDSQNLVIDGVREILKNYNVDGIHIDDYFYPLTEFDFDMDSYAEYCALGGTMALAQWRRDNVNRLVTAIYALVKTAGAEKIFSISPAADIDKNVSEYYADVRLWCSSPGYADMIIPQIYFGFEHESMPFDSVAAQWALLAQNSGVRLACGLAAYKQGKEDSFAGTGKNEWIDKSNLISSQIEHIRAQKRYSGYILFSFGYSFG